MVENFEKSKIKKCDRKSRKNSKISEEESKILEKKIENFTNINDRKMQKSEKSKNGRKKDRKFHNNK